MPRKINVAVVGLNFGALFAPNYLFHPNVNEVTICDLNRDLVKKVGERLGIQRRYYSLEDVLKDDSIDAVHLLTNIPAHVDQSVAILEAGKHCACAVPMSLTLQGVDRILAAQAKSGATYMLAETVIFTRNFLYVRKMIDSGEFGRIQFMRGAHYQDMEGWPKYWKGMPPMYYATHALAPAFAALKGRATKVVCFGSGKMREALHEPYGNPFPIETAVFEMEDGTRVEVTRTLFATPRGYTESFAVCGENVAFETGQLAGDLPVVWRYKAKGVFDPAMVLEKFTPMGREVSEDRVDPPDQLDLIPKEIHQFTRPHQMVSVTDPGDKYDYWSIGGFHPHVANEFVMSLCNRTKPKFDVHRSAELTAACLLAHESAMSGGMEVIIPKFSK